jgi:hypothetical protein
VCFRIPWGPCSTLTKAPLRPLRVDELGCHKERYNPKPEILSSISPKPKTLRPKPRTNPKPEGAAEDAVAADRQLYQRGGGRQPPKPTPGLARKNAAGARERHA